MIQRKQRKDPKDIDDLDETQQFPLTEPDPVHVASGFSISVKYDKHGKPVVYVKKYGDVDSRGLRREIERSYPGAAIQGLGNPKLIKMAKRRKQKSRTKETRTSDGRSPRPKSAGPTRD